MRQPGYYWVKLDGQWMIGEFNNESWYFCDPMLDSPGGRDDDDLDEIDENRIERTEKAILPDEPYDPTNDMVHYTCRDTFKEEGWGLGPGPATIPGHDWDEDLRLWVRKPEK